MRPTLLVVGLALLIGHSAAAQAIRIARPPQGDRIQLDRWTLRGGETREDGAAVSDPLTQIVRVFLDTDKGQAWGTGFFLPECRVMTALHVLIGQKRLRERVGDPASARLEKGESLIGETYAFETQPIPWRNGERARGTFVVLGHGEGEALSRPADTAGVSVDGDRRDWAIGYDEQCLSETMDLGSFITQYTLRSPPGERSFLAAGFPDITVAGAPAGKSPLYIDTRCTFGETGWLANQGSVAAWAETTCSVWFGMSGGPFLYGPLRLGNTLLTRRGRPVFAVAGILQVSQNKSSNDTRPDVPNFPTPASGVGLFNGVFEEQALKLLTGPVDLDRLRKR